MKNFLFALSLMAGSAGLPADTVPGFESDVFETDGEQVRITFVGHGSLMLEFGTIVIHVDPVSREADYSKFPEADIILITHEHQDHYDRKAIDNLRKQSTDIVVNPAVGKLFGGGTTLKNGDSIIVKDISISAVPAYNTTADRSRFHPRGRDNGYIIDLGGLLIYIAGDTEPIPDMGGHNKIDIAFLPVNQPYTMTPEQAVEAALMIKPAIFYPYHYGDTDVSGIANALRGEKIEVRIRNLQ